VSDGSSRAIRIKVFREQLGSETALRSYESYAYQFEPLRRGFDELDRNPTPTAVARNLQRRNSYAPQIHHSLSRMRIHADLRPSQLKKSFDGFHSERGLPTASASDSFGSESDSVTEHLAAGRTVARVRGRKN